MQGLAHVHYKGEKRDGLYQRTQEIDTSRMDYFFPQSPPEMILAVSRTLGLIIGA
jgi:hypothetical protein